MFIDFPRAWTLQVSLRTTSFAAFSLGRKLQKVKFALFPVVALIYSPAAMGLLLLLLFRALPPHAAVQGGLTGERNIRQQSIWDIGEVLLFQFTYIHQIFGILLQESLMRMNGNENAFSFDDDDDDDGDDDDDCVGNELKCPAWLVWGLLIRFACAIASRR